MPVSLASFYFNSALSAAPISSEEKCYCNKWMGVGWGLGGMYIGMGPLWMTNVWSRDWFHVLIALCLPFIMQTGLNEGTEMSFAFKRLQFLSIWRTIPIVVLYQDLCHKIIFWKGIWIATMLTCKTGFIVSGIRVMTYLNLIGAYYQMFLLKILTTPSISSHQLILW